MTMRPNRLNLLQRLIRTWEQVHPYNAAQFATISGAADLELARRAWAETIAALKIDPMMIDGTGIPFAPTENASRTAVTALPACASISDHLSTELNRPFADLNESPFRPFVTRRNDGAQTCGIVYRHWVADSNSVRRLLGDWIGRLSGNNFSRGAHANGSPVPGYLELCARRRSGAGLEGHVLDLFRRHNRLRRACKPVSGASDFSVRVLLADVPEGVAEDLRLACRRQGLKVSDALLAALAEACRRHVPFQSRPNRRDVAIGNIIDLRSHGSRAIENFGLYLGFTHLVCRPDELADWQRLLRSTARQNRTHRRAGVTHSSTAWWMTALAWQRWLPPGRLYHFYRKEFPLAGGLSNVRLDTLLPAWNSSTPILNYTRIAPTGPVAPVVMTTTTLGNRLRMALTYRPAVIDDASAAELLETFKRRIIHAAREKNALPTPMK